MAVGRVATGIVREFVADDRDRLRAAHQREIGQGDVEDPARQSRAAGFEHGRPGADEETLGEADDQGLGLERAHPFGESFDEAPQARRHAPPIHHRGERPDLIAGLARLHDGVGSAVVLAAVAELQAKIGAPVSRRPGLGIRHDGGEVVTLSGKRAPIVGAALRFPESEQ